MTILRKARAGKERHVVRLMAEGKRDEALAYMKENGVIAAFEGAPEGKPVSVAAEPRMGGIDEEPYKYPDFKPIRDPLPEGVRYAKIKRELGNCFQKIITWEDEFELPEHKRTEDKLWMTMKQQTTPGRIVGRVYPVTKNPDELQGGWIIWRKP